MNDFGEIIKTINRMPEALAAEQYEQMKSDPDAVERRVLEWAKDNPEPQYPTWGEWLCEVGVSRISSYQDNRPIYSRTKKFYEPMDAETAQKLGIEPTARK
jgi:hypothetical protein